MSVAVLGMSGVGAEVCKNLLLLGIGSVTVNYNDSFHSADQCIRIVYIYNQLFLDF
jgi:molybdopterin/thiamine biosynthesis adenylyltransferase